MTVEYLISWCWSKKIIEHTAQNMKLSVKDFFSNFFLKFIWD